MGLVSNAEITRLYRLIETALMEWKIFHGSKDLVHASWHKDLKIPDRMFDKVSCLYSDLGKIPGITGADGNDLYDKVKYRISNPKGNAVPTIKRESITSLVTEASNTYRTYLEVKKHG